MALARQSIATGDVIGGAYRLDSMLGRGAAGEVWAAEQLSSGRSVAIKFLAARGGATAVSRKRFIREGKTSLRIRHPAIVEFLDAGEHDGSTLYVVMERLRGEPLHEALDGFPPLATRDFVSIVNDVSRGLAAAHASGVIHRDIKPQNIFIVRRPDKSLQGKILDFGTSKVPLGGDSIATDVQALLGSPRYMSPEQMHSAAQIDARADIWSVGVVLFEGLTGEWPHDGDTLLEVAVAVTNQSPKSIDRLAPDLPAALRRIVTDCLQPVERRIPTAEDLALRLEAALESEDLDDLRLPVAASDDGPTRAVQRVLQTDTSSDEDDDPLPFIGDDQQYDGSTALMNVGLVRALREKSRRGPHVDAAITTDTEDTTLRRGRDPQQLVDTIRPAAHAAVATHPIGAEAAPPRTEPMATEPDITLERGLPGPPTESAAVEEGDGDHDHAPNEDDSYDGDDREEDESDDGEEDEGSEDGETRVLEPVAALRPAVIPPATGLSLTHPAPAATRRANVRSPSSLPRVLMVVLIVLGTATAVVWIWRYRSHAGISAEPMQPAR